MKNFREILELLQCRHTSDETRLFREGSREDVGGVCDNHVHTRSAEFD